MAAAIVHTSSSPKRIPMQVREPPPNGMYAPLGSVYSGTITLRPLSVVRAGPAVTTFPFELRTSIEFAKALKHADRPGGLEAARAHEQETERIGFVLFVLRVGAFQ